MSTTLFSPASPPPEPRTWATLWAPSGLRWPPACALACKAFYFLADYHALIKCEDPVRIQRSTLEIAASWLASGLDPEKVTFTASPTSPRFPS